MNLCRSWYRKVRRIAFKVNKTLQETDRKSLPLFNKYSAAVAPPTLVQKM